MTLVLVFSYVHAPLSVHLGTGHLGTHTALEVREYLAGLVCCLYALELLARRLEAPVSWAPFASIKLRVARVSLLRRIRRRLERAQEAGSAPARRIPASPVLWVCSLVMVCSVGLAFFYFLSARAAVSAAEETYRSIVSGVYGEPAGRSTFDVYLIENENRLVYFKETCKRADREPRFFLHLTPAAAEDLPDHRRQYGYDNRDFSFGGHRLDVTLEGGCIRTVPLPDYAISRILTGQFTGEGRLWAVQFSPP